MKNTISVPLSVAAPPLGRADQPEDLEQVQQPVGKHHYCSREHREPQHRQTVPATHHYTFETLLKFCAIKLKRKNKIKKVKIVVKHENILQHFHYKIIKRTVPVLDYDWLCCLQSHCEILYKHTSVTSLNQYYFSIASVCSMATILLNTAEELNCLLEGLLFVNK